LRAAASFAFRGVEFFCAARLSALTSSARFLRALNRHPPGGNPAPQTLFRIRFWQIAVRRARLRWALANIACRRWASAKLAAIAIDTASTKYRNSPSPGICTDYSKLDAFFAHDLAMQSERSRMNAATLRVYCWRARRNIPAEVVWSLRN